MFIRSLVSFIVVQVALVEWQLEFWTFFRVHNRFEIYSSYNNTKDTSLFTGVDYLLVNEMKFTQLKFDRSLLFEMWHPLKVSQMFTHGRMNHITKSYNVHVYHFQTLIMISLFESFEIASNRHGKGIYREAQGPDLWEGGVMQSTVKSEPSWYGKSHQNRITASDSTGENFAAPGK